MGEAWLADLIRVWILSRDHHTFMPPASEKALQRAEKELGRPIPRPLRELYRFSDGLDLFAGNLQIYPLREGEGQLGLVSASARLRAWGWPIPEEVWVFGDDGSDELLGIWLPETGREGFDHPVLLIGEIFEPKCMAVAGTSLSAFLRGWTAFYLLAYEADPMALDLLGLPESLRYGANELDDEHFVEILRWADPGLPDPDPDPYRRGLDGEDLKRLFQS